MKILLLTATYLPSTNGVAISVANLFKQLTKMGHEVYVLAPRNKRQKQEKNVIRYLSLPNPVVPDYPIPLLPVTSKLVKTLLEHKFDIVHAHHPFHIAFFADLMAGYSNAPFVFHFHTRYEMHIKAYTKHLTDQISSMLGDYTTKRVLKRADVVIAPSKYIHGYLKRIDSKAVVRVVPTGLANMKRPKENKNELRKKLKLPVKKNILLCVSRLSEEKNLRLTIDSMEYLSDEYLLTIVGGGPIEEKLKLLVKRKHIERKIKFAGRVKHDKVGNYYSAADIFVSPSVSETQGLTLLEAASFGLPVVSVKNEVNEEFTSSLASILTNNNAKSFSMGVKELMSEDTGKMAKVAIKFARDYTQEKTTGAVIKVYREAVKIRKKYNKGGTWEKSKSDLIDYFHFGKRKD